MKHNKLHVLFHVSLIDRWSLQTCIQTSGAGGKLIWKLVQQHDTTRNTVLRCTILKIWTVDNLKKAELDETLVYEIPIKVSSCLELLEAVRPKACVLSPVDPHQLSIRWFAVLRPWNTHSPCTTPVSSSSEVLQTVNMDIFRSQIQLDYLRTPPKFCDCIDEVCCDDFGITIGRVCLHPDYMKRKPINASVCKLPCSAVLGRSRTSQEWPE